MDPNQMPLLTEAVKRGILRLKARMLDYSPRDEDLGKVASVMIDDLIAQGLTDDDAHRVAIAMESVGRRQRTWPKVPDIIGALPASDRFVPPMLEAKPTEKGEAIANLKAIKRMIAGSGVIASGGDQ